MCLYVLLSKFSLRYDHHFPVQSLVVELSRDMDIVCWYPVSQQPAASITRQNGAILQHGARRSLLVLGAVFTTATRSCKRNRKWSLAPLCGHHNGGGDEAIRSRDRHMTVTWLANNMSASCYGGNHTKDWSRPILATSCRNCCVSSSQRQQLLKINVLS